MVFYYSRLIRGYILSAMIYKDIYGAVIKSERARYVYDGIVMDRDVQDYCEEIGKKISSFVSVTPSYKDKLRFMIFS